MVPKQIYSVFWYYNLWRKETKIKVSKKDPYRGNNDEKKDEKHYSKA